MLKVLDHLPEGFLSVSAAQLQQVLDGPTLISLPGRQGDALFVSALLHGNEDVGLLALQELLTKYKDTELPRPLTFFVGNVEAAAQGMRFLDHQADYNRVWPCSELVDSTIIETPEHKMMVEVVQRVTQSGVFASVDMHNNTGLNPHYACVNRLDDAFLQLATLFSRTVVYFTRPLGVQSLAMATHCPSVTIECGRTGDGLGVQHATNYIDSLLHLDHFPQHAVAPGDLDLFHTVAIVKVPREAEFGFGEGKGDIRFINNLDHYNFSEVESGTLMANTHPDSKIMLDVVSDEGEVLIEHYFDYADNQIRFKRKVMPSMLTLDENVIRQDCLCYLMERYPLQRD